MGATFDEAELLTGTVTMVLLDGVFLAATSSINDNSVFGSSFSSSEDDVRDLKNKQYMLFVNNQPAPLLKSLNECLK